ncbi:S8 family serine peptidase, partial [Pseudovibrio sp. POLY-S9]
STSRLVENDNGSTFGDDYEATQGTSFAAPIVSGVVALMLEANPLLGWRDVQEILALSAKQVDDPSTEWSTNGASTWNGGG